MENGRPTSEPPPPAARPPGARRGRRSGSWRASFRTSSIEAEAALLLLGREIYQRGGLVVRPVLTDLKAADNRDMRGWRLIPVTRPYLVDTLTCAARFLKHDGRSKAWVATDAPDKVAETYLARQGRWKLPVLTGIIHTPFLRADGSICELPGYDTASGLLFKPDGQSFPPIPQHPSKADAIEALAQLEHLISTFPFVAAADRSVALSAILTTLDRRSMATAPLHAFTSPTRRHGEKPAGRRRRRARHRPADAGDRTGKDRGGARETPRRGSAGWRRRRSRWIIAITCSKAASCARC